MLYESKYTDLQVLVRSESIQYHSATGVEIGRIRPLTCDFGTHGGEYMATNPLTGETERHAMIFGRYYDTEEAKDRLGWDDDEHDSVVATLDKLCREQPFLIAKVEMNAPVIVKPWPTYDDTHWKTVPVLAEQLGLVEVALTYERDNKNRAPIIKALEELLQGDVRSHIAEEPQPELITLDA